MPASLSRAIIQAGVGRLPSTSRTTRVTKTLAPTRPRIGAASSIVTLKPVAWSALSGDRRRRRIAERRAGRVRVLAGDAADRERVAAVGRDVDLDGRVVEPEQGRRVGADLRVEAERGQAQDAVVLVAETEFACRGDHAVGDVAVGLARGDRERAGQHGARQRHDDLVAHEEVAGAADDAAHVRRRRRPPSRPPARRAPGTSGWSCRWSAAPRRTRAPGRRRSGPEISNVWTSSSSSPTETRAACTSSGRRSGLQVDVLAEPTQGDAHQTTIPNCWENRTSPSAMSRMSLTSLRNISARSTPIPNAKPE